MTQLARCAARQSLLWLLPFLLLGAARSAQAVDMFLQVTTSGTTTVPGESVDKDHKGWIDVLDWSWGLSLAVTNTGSGASTGKVNMRELTLTKYLDKASPRLMLNCGQGGPPLAKVELEVRRTGSTNKMVKITLENVLITSVQTGGSSGEDRLTESVTFNFQKMTLAYTPVDDKGAAQAEVIFIWDAVANAGS